MKNILFAAIAAFCTSMSFAQDSTALKHNRPSTTEDGYSQSNFGLGAGLDYGGLGFKMNLLLVKPVAVFGSAGYNLDKLVFAGGFNFRMKPEARVCPTLQAMYGYNAVIRDENSKSGKTYYGPSFGLGLEFHGKKKTGNFFNLELLVPVRSQKFKDEIDRLKEHDQNPTVLPIAVSIGYHFGD
jgi:hypothetical protein